MLLSLNESCPYPSKNQNSKPDRLQIYGQSHAEGYSCGERRRIVIRLRLVIEEVVDGGIETDAAPEVVLKHQLPDGIALIDIGTARLGFAEAAP